MRGFPGLGKAICLVLGLTGCAGPTTPFGAINGFGDYARIISSKLFRGLASSTVIRFTPRRQVLHDRITFDVVIDDPAGVPESFQLLVIHNDRDVTSAFMRGASKTYLDPMRRQLRLTTKNLRLRATSDHAIRVVYMREKNGEPVVADFHPPTCRAFEAERSIASVPHFRAPPEFVRLINKHARRERLNPYYLAGLIAQESSFDPHAISSAKALGLTQITSLGASEITKVNADWPSYPGIENMSVLELRLAVMNGQINAKNEWRLNPELSIHGGVDYLGYLTEYWSRPEKRAQIKDVELGEILLASYNSGAARVSRAVERKGKDWLEDDGLTEARRYVRRVVSYCDYFANERD